MVEKIFKILILPYIEISDDFNIGNLSFYSFEKSGKKFIKNEELYKKIEILLNCFKHFNFNRFEYIQYCDGTLINQDMNSKQILNPFDVVDLLAYVSSKSGLMKPNNWDIKEVIIKKNNDNLFNIDDNIRFPESILSKLTFYPPDFLERIIFKTSHFLPNIIYDNLQEPTLLRGLLSCYSKSRRGRNRSEYQRIITAIKFRNQSERLEYRYKPNVRIILMASAFEALLNLSDTEIQKSFSNTVNVLLGSCSEELINWAIDFYRLRSDIVHGKTSKPNIKYKSKINNIPPHVKHYSIAKIVFDECLKTRLYLMNLFESYQFLRIYGLESIDKILTPNKKKIIDLLKLSPVEVCKDKTKTAEFLKNINLIKEWDESTTNEDCIKLLGHISLIYKESIKILLKDEKINKKYLKPLNEVLDVIKNITVDEKLHLEIYWTIGKYNQGKNKLWENWKINDYLVIDTLSTIMQKISRLIR